MQRASKAALRFVRSLLAGAGARREGGTFVAAVGTALPAAETRELVAQGVIAGDSDACRAIAGTAQWLKRQMLDADAFAAQHRVEAKGAEGATMNLAESPLVRLATPGPDGAAFLKPHQVEAGERLRRLVERAQLQPRLTMSYSAAHVAGGGAGHSEIGDMAADARKALANLHHELPRDCAEVVLDVCGFGKGLQQVEAERGWPRRSAKLVLRIALDRLAEIYGLSAAATGTGARQRGWMEGPRVAMFE